MLTLYFTDSQNLHHIFKKKTVIFFFYNKVPITTLKPKIFLQIKKIFSYREYNYLYLQDKW